MNFAPCISIGRGKYFYTKVKIIPARFCNYAKLFPGPKVQKMIKWKTYLQKLFEISSLLLNLMLGEEFLSNILLSIFGKWW